jgi:HD domain-containing protein
MRATSGETGSIFGDEFPGSATVGSRRPAARFAGSPMAQAALRFARACHAGQRREVDHAAFIAHPIEVGLLLRRDGQPDEVIAAGLLHDVLEKTATTSAELQRRFGARILRLVESVSDDPSIGEYTSRKRELRDRVARGDSNTRAIFAADKIAKVRELALLPARRLGETKVRAELAHYRASLEMLRRVDGDLPLVDCLDAELNHFLARAGSGTQSAGPFTSATASKRTMHRARQSE